MQPRVISIKMSDQSNLSGSPPLTPHLTPRAWRVVFMALGGVVGYLADFSFFFFSGLVGRQCLALVSTGRQYTEILGRQTERTITEPALHQHSQVIIPHAQNERVRPIPPLLARAVSPFCFRPFLCRLSIVDCRLSIVDFRLVYALAALPCPAFCVPCRDCSGRG